MPIRLIKQHDKRDKGRVFIFDHESNTYSTSIGTYSISLNSEQGKILTINTELRSPIDKPFNSILISELIKYSRIVEIISPIPNPNGVLFNRNLSITFLNSKSGISCKVRCFVSRNEMLEKSTSIYLFFFLRNLSRVYSIGTSEVNFMGSINSIQEYLKHSAEHIQDGIVFFQLEKNVPNMHTDVSTLFKIFKDAISSAHEYANSEMDLIFNEAVLNDNKNEIKREIEFTPETYLAGLGIINYFKNFLENQYPEEKAHVKIEQFEHSVRMTVTPESGKPEIVEEALSKYESIITNKISANDIITNEYDLIELRNELRIAYSRIEGQRELLAAKNDELDSKDETIRSMLKAIESLGKSKSDVIVNIQNQNEVSNTVSIESELSTILELLVQIISTLKEDTTIHSELDSLISELRGLATETDSDKIKNSSGWKKLWAFVDKFNDGHTFAENVFKTGKKGSEVLAKIAPQILELLDKMPS